MSSAVQGAQQHVLPSAHIASSLPNLKNAIPKLTPRMRRQAPSNPTSVPETPALPPPPELDDWTFKTPSRRILTPEDHKIFLASSTNKLVQSWIFSLADAVIDTPCVAVKEDDSHHLNPVIITLLGVLDEADSLVTQSPPNEQGGSRFGNKAFRTFIELIGDRRDEWHHKLGLRDEACISEVSSYLSQSFGNRDRIDYGSGHELNFAMWLLCLYQLKLINASDFKPLVLHVFVRYLILMRRIQMTYYLEPAGSHGVWGLDDYQFLPFLFGAAQLLHHPYITPRAIHQQLTIEEFGNVFMYLGQVDFVNSTKTVKGLRWHSPMLDDISSAKTWGKIDGGMRRMFVAEVLGKLPVMQHFMFGSLIPAAEGMSVDAAGHEGESAPDVDAAADGNQADHTHDGTGWGDCCGIKVPSSVAAAQELKKAGHGQPLRRIPFD